MTGLIDHRGQPLRKEVLTREVSGPTMGSARSPTAGYPADGLNPIRLAQILRSADMGEARAYFELAELIEERDSHYAGILGTRKRQVSQIDVTVDAASESPLDIEIANRIRDWIDRDELVDETFDILDAVGKGISSTEIIWDTSMGQWQPARLEWRDQRWFTVDPIDKRTPLLRGGEDGKSADSALAPFKFIQHHVKAKSGLPVRSGLARIAAWNWMFKAFTLRDWAIFVQTYGQPVRIGKFRAGASEEDKRTLFQAVANIAGDMAAIIPEGMDIEFKESANVSAGAELFERRADWVDRQNSKAVLGQTGTTDSKQGGLGDGGNAVHDSVREDIETADCKGISATLNRDLVRPWVDLDYGPQKAYPRLRVARPKTEDLKALADGLNILVPLGMRVGASQIRDKYGLSAPAAGDEILGAPQVAQPPSRIGQPSLRLLQSLQAAQVPVAKSVLPADAIGDRLTSEGRADMVEMFEQIEAMMAAAQSLEEFGEMLRSGFADLEVGREAARIGDALVAAHTAGQFDVEESAGA